MFWLTVQGDTVYPVGRQESDVAGHIASPLRNQSKQKVEPGSRSSRPSPSNLYLLKDPASLYRLKDSIVFPNGATS